MSTQTIASTNKSQEYSMNYETGQYTLWQILVIWLVGSAPMWLLGWVVAPLIMPYSRLNPLITFWLLMIAGMVWQFVVSLVIICRELGTLKWSAICERTWLQAPQDPKTARRNPRLFWWLLPMLFLAGLVQIGLAGYLEVPLVQILPEPAVLPDMSQLASPEFRGQWWLLAIALVSYAFNYFLGEEFLFRGVLLPKMQMVFGKYDWIANAVLFGLYHLHRPSSVLMNIVGTLPLTWPTRRFRSNWFAVVIHGVEAFLTLIPLLGIILGVMPD